MANFSESFKGNSQDEASLRLQLLLAAFLYTAFVVYGSLVPLEYRSMPFNEAIARFQRIPFLELGIDSRADWVANFLLFIPLTFLWLAALSFSKGLGGAVNSALAILTATLLSIGIEFTQIFFPQRTVSQNDIFAETLGGIFGVVLFLIYGIRFRHWLTAWMRDRAATSILEKLVFAYLSGVIVYNILPLDLTISAIEVFNKWQEGKVKLVPFSALPADPVHLIYNLSADIVTWIPLAFVWRFLGIKNTWQALWTTVAIAFGLEFAQLLVYSRVTDTTDVFTAMIGATIGAWLGARFASEQNLPDRAQATSAWQPFSFVIAWSLILLLVFWYPFDFTVDSTFIRERMSFLHRLPFKVYYFGSEYRAITEVLHKTLFFAPLGALLGWGTQRVALHWRRLVSLASISVIIMLPLMIEFGQVLLPGKIPDTTDWLLACLGGIAGYIIINRLLRPAPPAARLKLIRPLPNPSLISRQKVAKPITKYLHFILVVSALTIVAGSAATIQSIPYNFRELFQNEHPWISSALLAICCYWTAVWPVWLSGLNPAGWRRWVRVPAGISVYGGVIYILLRAAVPKESLFDMVGSPVLGWNDDLETALRWVALAAFLGAVFILVRQVIGMLAGRKAVRSEILSAALLLLISYWGIVDQASTDNLLELMAYPYMLSFVMLTGWLFSLFLSSALLASQTFRHRFGASVFFTIILLAVSLALLHLGLSSEIHKYGQNFSAIQFLLSTDRNHYTDEATAWLRYVMLHIFTIAVCTLIQWPYWNEMRLVPTALNQRAFTPSTH